MSVPLLITLAACFRTPAMLGAFAACSVVTGTGFTWLAFFKLDVSNGIIVYRSLFGGVITLPINEIKSAQVKAGVFSYRDRFKPTVRLEIKTAADADLISINLKVFDSKQIKRLLDFFKRIDVGKTETDTIIK